MRTQDKVLILIAILAVLGFGVMLFSFMGNPDASSSVALEPMDTYSDPDQKEVSGIPLPVIEYGKKRVFLSAKAEYRIGGILVSKRRYTNGFMSDLSPWDYAMIWGDVPNFINHIKFDQIVRYCLFKYDPSQGIDVDYVSRHLSNNHLIPANKNIRKALKAGKKGMSVELSGYLVDVDAVLPGGGSQTWRSSMKRDDTAGGACEIIYVTRLRLGDRVYE